MKCMMSVDGSKIVRVSDEKASELYSEGFRYVSKSLWKDQLIFKVCKTIFAVNKRLL